MTSYFPQSDSCSQNLWMCYFSCWKGLYKCDYVGVFSWGNDSGVSIWAQYKNKGPTKWEEEGPELKRKTKHRSRVGVVGQLPWKQGPQAEQFSLPLETGNGKERHSCNLQKEHRSVCTLILVWLNWFLPSNLLSSRRINIYCFKPLNLWLLVRKIEKWIYFLIMIWRLNKITHVH